MNNKIIFYRCNHCGNIFLVIKDGKVNPICCNEKMEKLVPGSVDASIEKHVPVINISGNIVAVNIGEIAHPMVEEHKIDWIYIQTKRGGTLKRLEVGEEPKRTFAMIEDELIAVYSYCNIHGLWEYIIKEK